MTELIVKPVGEPGYRVALDSASLRIGRSAKNEICLEADSAVSRYHARITVADDGYFIEDVGSHNGTFMDGRPVAFRMPILPGSRIRIGNTVILLGDSEGDLDEDEASPFGELSENSVILSASQFVGEGPSAEGTVAGLTPGATRPRARAFAALSAWAPNLVSERPLPEVLTQVLDMVFKAISPERAALLLLEGQPPKLTLRASRGMQPDADGSEIVSSTITERVIQRRQSVLTSDAQADPRFMDAHSIVVQSVQAAMSVPLWNNTEVIGMIYVDTVGGLAAFSKVDLEVLTLLANLSAIKIDHVRLFERDQKMRELERELRAAAQIQRRLLPGEPPSVDGYEICGRNDPCHAVGGDYFDFQHRDNGCLGVALGDVSGKGMGAALLMATLQASFRAHAGTGVSPERLVEQLNRAVCANSEADKFITFFYGELDARTHTLRYVNAGHNPPQLLRADGTLEPLRTGGLILGFEPTVRYAVKQVALAPGDLLLMYTDGVTEAQDPDEQEFGEQRLSEIARAAGQAPVTDIVRRIRATVDTFTRGAEPFDDFTVCLVRRTC